MHFDSATISLAVFSASAIYYAGRTTRLLESLVEDVKELKRWREQVENSAPKAFVKSAGAH